MSGEARPQTTKTVRCLFPSLVQGFRVDSVRDGKSQAAGRYTNTGHGKSACVCVCFTACLQSRVAWPRFACRRGKSCKAGADSARMRIRDEKSCGAGTDLNPAVQAPTLRVNANGTVHEPVQEVVWMMHDSCCEGQPTEFLCVLLCVLCMAAYPGRARVVVVRRGLVRVVLGAQKLHSAMMIPVRNKVKCFMVCWAVIFFCLTFALRVLPLSQTARHRVTPRHSRLQAY